MVTMIWELMQYIWMRLRKSYSLFKVNGGQMEYQIHSIFIHTGNQKANDYVLRPISQLMRKTNDEISTITNRTYSKFSIRIRTRICVCWAAGSFRGWGAGFLY